MLRSTFWKASIFSASLLTASSAMAKDDVVFGASYFQLSHTSGSRTPGATDVSNTSEERSFRFLSFGGCYALTEYLCAGGKYTTLDVERVTSTEIVATGVETSIGSKSSLSGLGLSVGFQGESFSAIASYFLDGTRKDSRSTNGFSADAGEYSDGLAYQLDIGWGFKVKPFRIGPMLTIMHFDYGEEKTAGGSTTLTNDLQDDFIMPSVSFWLGL